MELGRSLYRFFPLMRASWNWISCDPLLRISPSLFSQQSHTCSTPVVTIACHHFNSSSVSCLTYPRHFVQNANFSTRREASLSHTPGQMESTQKKLSSFDELQNPRQFLSRDKKTIVCVHPTNPTPFSRTKPLRPAHPGIKQLRDSLTEEEVKLVRKLRSTDGALWTVNTLARHFNVKRGVISKVAPADPQRQRELDQEKVIMAAMKPYKRKLYKAQKQMERQKRLEELISRNKDSLNMSK